MAPASKASPRALEWPILHKLLSLIAKVVKVAANSEEVSKGRKVCMEIAITRPLKLEVNMCEMVGSTTVS